MLQIMIIYNLTFENCDKSIKLKFFTKKICKIAIKVVSLQNKIKVDYGRFKS